MVYCNCQGENEADWAARLEGSPTVVVDAHDEKILKNLLTNLTKCDTIKTVKRIERSADRVMAYLRSVPKPQKRIKKFSKTS